jgi:hypothetical protein
VVVVKFVAPEVKHSVDGAGTSKAFPSDDGTWKSSANDTWYSFVTPVQPGTPRVRKKTGDIGLERFLSTCLQEKNGPMGHFGQPARVEKWS